MLQPKAQVLFDWLLDGAPGAPGAVEVVSRLGLELVEAGIPVQRVSAFVRTLHPSVIGRSFVWSHPAPTATVSELNWALLQSPKWLESPLAECVGTGREVRQRIASGSPSRFKSLEDLGRQGFTDYLALPMRFMGGSTHVIAFASQIEGGFSDEHLDVLRTVVRPLTRVAETLALMRTAANLLNTYVGRDAGDRILKGQIQRGDTENIRCVVWFSDLRGFTSLSGERSPREVIAVLNELFDCQVPALEKHGGEVLKFMGDGILAIFPLKEGVSAADAGARALLASKDAYAALDQLNQRRLAKNEVPLRFGVALHVGDVAYGNIGGSNRLDFTCIGTAVNVASRIEGLTGKLNKRVLLSADLAAQLTQPTREVGTFELKGVTQPQQVFEATG